MNLVTGESQMEKPDEDEDEEDDEEVTDGEGKRDEKTTPEDETVVGGGDWDSHFKNGDRGENETLPI